METVTGEAGQQFDRREFPVIWRVAVGGQPGEKDGRFAGLWKEYEPKVRKIALSFCIPGQVGAEMEDLMQVGQWSLLNAIRTYDAGREADVWDEQGNLQYNEDGTPKKRRVQFNTYFYTCLRNQYWHLSRERFPTEVFEVKATDPKTGVQEIVVLEQVSKRSRSDHKAGKARAVASERTLLTPTELEAKVLELRCQGKTCTVIKKTPKTRHQPAWVSSLDYGAETDQLDEGVDDWTLSDVIASPDEDLTIDQLIERVANCIPEEQMRRIAVMLLEGHKMSGKGGIQERFGMNKHQAERNLIRIRQLLAGEFGLRFRAGEGWV